MAKPDTTPSITLPFPIELRRKILAELLVDKRSRSMMLHLSKASPQAPYRHDRKQQLQDEFLQFSALRQVSKAMREEAQEVFFEQNTWALVLNYWSQYVETEPNVFNTLPICINTAEFIKETWGEHALLRMRDVRLSISGTNQNQAGQIREALQDIVQIFQRTQNLKNFELEWKNQYSLNSGNKQRSNFGTGRAAQLQRQRKSNRLVDGTRQMPSLPDWADDEIVLEPLKALRGLNRAVVTGAVTDQWALYLEKCMKSTEAIVPDFERKEGIPDVISQFPETEEL